MESSSRENSHSASMTDKKINVQFNVEGEGVVKNVFNFIESVYEKIMNIDAIKEGGKAEIIIGETTIEFSGDAEKNETSIIKLAGIALGVTDLSGVDEGNYDAIITAAEKFIKAQDTSNYKVENFTLKIGDMEIEGLSANFGKIDK